MNRPAQLNRLAWGYADAAPEDATSAWGARATVTQDGWVDILPDRVDLAGPPTILGVRTPSSRLIAFGTRSPSCSAPAG
jgi:hypothetical protein